MKDYYKIVIKELESLGFRFVRNGKGSHQIWAKNNCSVCVPFHLQSRHTANAILKQVGCSKKL